MTEDRPVKKLWVERKISREEITFGRQAFAEYIKTDMAYELASKLKEEGYIRYISCNDTIRDCGRVRAEITVVEGE